MKNVFGKVDDVSLPFKYKFVQSIRPFTSKFDPVILAEGNLFTKGNDCFLMNLKNKFDHY